MEEAAPALQDNRSACTQQAAELDMDGVAAILATLGDSPRDLRDAALLPIASDSLCRESELVAIEAAHLHLNRRRNT